MRVLQLHRDALSIVCAFLTHPDLRSILFVSRGGLTLLAPHIIPKLTWTAACPKPRHLMPLPLTLNVCCPSEFASHVSRVCLRNNFRTTHYWSSVEWNQLRELQLKEALTPVCITKEDLPSALQVLRLRRSNYAEQYIIESLPTTIRELHFEVAQNLWRVFRPWAHDYHTRELYDKPLWWTQRSKPLDEISGSVRYASDEWKGTWCNMREKEPVLPLDLAVTRLMISGFRVNYFPPETDSVIKPLWSAHLRVLHLTNLQSTPARGHQAGFYAVPLDVVQLGLAHCVNLEEVILERLGCGAAMRVAAHEEKTSGLTTFPFPNSLRSLSIHTRTLDWCSKAFANVAEHLQYLDLGQSVSHFAALKTVLPSLKTLLIGLNVVYIDVDAIFPSLQIVARSKAPSTYFELCRNRERSNLNKTPLPVQEIIFSPNGWNRVTAQLPIVIQQPITKRLRRPRSDIHLTTCAKKRKTKEKGM